MKNMTSLLSLSALSDDEREQYMKRYNHLIEHGDTLGFKFMRPASEFNEYGLRFPVEYLNSIGKNIIFLPLELMAEYVDVITKTNVDENDPIFIYQIIDTDFNLDAADEWNNLNATGLGNLAYVTVHCKNEKAAQHTKNILHTIFVKQKGILLNQMNETI